MEKYALVVGDTLSAAQSQNIQVVNEETHQIFSEYVTEFEKLALDKLYHLKDLTPPLPKRFRGLEVKPVRDSKTDPKQNRNDLCLCESGKKYKNCCIKI